MELIDDAYYVVTGVIEQSSDKIDESAIGGKKMQYNFFGYHLSFVYNFLKLRE